MLDSPCIILDHVSKRFEAKRALEQVSATIRPGEFVAIIGKSGAGKTTLLRCLACSIPVSDGCIRFGDQDLAALRGATLRRHRARVGMIYQQFNLVRRLRVLDNVLIGRLPHLTGWRRWAALGRYFDIHQQGWRCAASITWGFSTAFGNVLTRSPGANSNASRSPKSWRRSHR